MKRILVSDYDRTFYVDDQGIMKNIEAVEKFRKSGNLFIIATGRSFDDFMVEPKKYPIQYDYLVINQGATILDTNHVVLKNTSIDDKIKNELVKRLEPEKQPFSFSCRELESRADINKNGITKIHISYPSEELQRKSNQEINNEYGKYVNSYLISGTTNAIEIISSETSKSKAIQYICDLEKIRNNNVFVIGDSYNDINMIETFDGYCMIDSEKEVKRLIQKQISSVSKLIQQIMGE